ncbi:AAA family ATPase [Nocardioides donggukensis]|uniref:CobQ/CobB/MinD/ParA nucleotide binding domain-containing protein n=1 Tax=Nocardioides donggukensis TaxID=2774019 RepID=A0A927K6R9_9ACTN|nr:hypothetical protein [Nocardioides donggukensis]MBD8868735.1 hypothetical protein [Nocardioides donggukensis]
MIPVPAEARVCVLVVAAGAPWESRALAGLGERPGVVVLKRCMDVTDLLASATSGQAQVAVVSVDAPGLDGAAVDHLGRSGVRVVAVAPDPGAERMRDHLARLGVAGVVGADALADLPEAVLSAAGGGASGAAAPGPPAGARSDAPASTPATGRTVAVWGPAGAPGRTTVALGLAGELARRGADPLLLDVDPWGGAVAQHLGVLDEVSGLLACARSTPRAELADRFLGLQRRVAGIRVLTGLPRPDRWVEVRPGTVTHLVELGRGQGPVLLDTGFCLEEDPGADVAGRPGRNALTTEALRAADAVLAVGTADPVGLTRLARGLVELRELLDGRGVHVVVNRMRGSLGWSEDEVRSMVTGFARVESLHLLPEDRSATDRALLAGRTLTETGDSGLSRALAGIVDVVVPGPAGARANGRPSGLLSRRTAGRARRP